jgi:hypothetical protein
MLDLDAQNQFADMSTAVLRSYARAAAQTVTVAARSFTLWSDLLRVATPGAGPPRSLALFPSPVEFYSRLPPAGWVWAVNLNPWSSSSWAWPAAGGTGAHAPLAQLWPSPGHPILAWIPLAAWSTLGLAASVGDLAHHRAPPAAFSSYRSPGGHAAAQVIAH